MQKSSNLDVLEAEGFKLSGRVTTPEMYVDGWSQLLVGYPLTKIVLHSLVEPKHGDNAKEERRAIATLCIPTITIIQLAQTILAGCKDSESQLGIGADQAANQLKAALAQVVSKSIPPGMEHTKLSD